MSMTWPPITSKEQMYGLLSGGALGNTIPWFGSVRDWEDFDPYSIPYWGIRTLRAGGPYRLNCPVLEVVDTANRPEFISAGLSIGAMISSVSQVTWLGDVWDDGGSLVLSGVEYPPRVHDWRELMRRPTNWTGVEGRMLLRRHLNPSSLADLYAVFDLWPGHVVELSVLDRCYGTVPGRNAVVWECRLY